MWRLSRNGFRTAPLPYFAVTAFTEWTVVVAALGAIALYNESVQVEERARSIARTVYYRNTRSTMLLGLFTLPKDSLNAMPVAGRLAKDSSSLAQHRLLFEAAGKEESASALTDVPFPMHARIVSQDSALHRYASDGWEAAAMAKLAPTQSEISEVLENAEGGKVLRYAGALRDAKVCTQCHERADYEAGTLRGVMSVSVPLAPIWAMETAHRSVTLGLLATLWLVGIAGILLTRRGLLLRIRERDDAREESRRMGLEKSKADAALAASARELTKAEQRLQAEKLRTEIAGNLHDDIGSTLSSTAIFTELLSKELTGAGSPRALKLLSRIRYNLLAVQLSMHEIVWAINPENDSLDAMLLKLQEYASDLLEENGITLRCTIAPSGRPLTVPMNVRKELLLIFKEAINNIVRHAQARCVTLTIRCMDAALDLSISDDGKGFTARSNGEGNGLKNMKLRAEKLSGSLEVSSRPGEGTGVRITLPLA